LPRVIPPQQTWVHNPLTNAYALERGTIAKALIKGGIIRKSENPEPYGPPYETNHSRVAEFLFLSGGIRDVRTKEGQHAIRALRTPSRLPLRCFDAADGQLKTLAVETLVEGILPYLRPKDIAVFGKTCNYAYRAIQSYVSHNKNVRYRLVQFNIFEAELAAILARSATWSAIIGDFPLQVFLGERYPITDIILFCGDDVRRSVLDYLLQKGYSFKNKVRRKAGQTVQHGNILIRERVTFRLENHGMKDLQLIVEKRKYSHLMCWISFKNGAADNVACRHPVLTQERRILASDIGLGVFDRYAAYGFKAKA
jgi:hypothetical protein